MVGTTVDWGRVGDGTLPWGAGVGTSFSGADVGALLVGNGAGVIGMVSGADVGALLVGNGAGVIGMGSVGEIVGPSVVAGLPLSPPRVKAKINPTMPPSNTRAPPAINSAFFLLFPEDFSVISSVLLLRPCLGDEAAAKDPVPGISLLTPSSTSLSAKGLSMPSSTIEFEGLEMTVNGRVCSGAGWSPPAPTAAIPAIPATPAATPAAATASAATPLPSLDLLSPPVLSSSSENVP